MVDRPAAGGARRHLVAVARELRREPACVLRPLPSESAEEEGSDKQPERREEPGFPELVDLTGEPEPRAEDEHLSLIHI